MSEGLIEAAIEVAGEAFIAKDNNKQKGQRTKPSTGKWALGLAASVAVVGGVAYLTSRKKDDAPQSHVEHLESQPSSEGIAL